VDAAAALAEMFGLPWWQLTPTATDANRAVLRHARAITARSKVLVFNHCCHGNVDETLGVARADTVGVEFNDVVALEAALAAGDVACVLAEPAMTHAGLVLPQAGFLQALRAACTRSGTLLVIDETHTLSAARGGYARSAGLAADFLVCGKAVAGGVSCGIYGCSDPIAGRIPDTTLSANPLSLAALLACLREVMTPAAYQHMDHLAGELAKRLGAAFAARALPWHVARVGARVAFGRGPPPLNGSQSLAQADPALEAALHLYLLNRGFVLTPFHNMMLVSPATTRTQIDGFMKVFEEALVLFDQR
jgi:glutamate-1-semialdehyde 2,1-aminomutase